MESAQKALFSAIRKSEKVQATLSQKQPPRTPQLTMVSQRLKVLRLSSSLIARMPKQDITENYPREDLEEALRTLPLIIRQIEKIQPNFKEGSSQYTLAVRRIKAFNIAIALIERELATER
ncbi:hypothetical protein [Dehalogenimonas etheniformans]|nr:hypothetical protein [Dehalogenimonas etheniformans]